MLSWSFADTNATEGTPLKWSTRKSFDPTVAEVKAENENFARPINVIEYEGDVGQRTYKACSLDEWETLYQGGLEANICRIVSGILRLHE